MTPLASRLADTRTQGRAALIGYLPAGFPNPQASVRLLRALVAGGVDVLEVGLPYSDPLMDGPVIQEAAQAALLAGTTTPVVLDVVRQVSDAGAPVVVMSYWNPIERFGVDRFARDLAGAGGCGLVTPDLTIEESDEWTRASDAHGIDRIFLVAPSSTPARIAAVTTACSGFVYAASTMGVTGTRTSVSTAASGLVERVRLATDLPVAVGLGVSTRDQAREVGAYADGVIVGSAFVRAVLDSRTADGSMDVAAAESAVRQLAESLSAGIREAR